MIIHGKNTDFGYSQAKNLYMPKFAGWRNISANPDCKIIITRMAIEL